MSEPSCCLSCACSLPPTHTLAHTKHHQYLYHEWVLLSMKKLSEFLKYFYLPQDKVMQVLLQGQNATVCFRLAGTSKGWLKARNLRSRQVGLNGFSGVGGSEEHWIRSGRPSQSVSHTILPETSCKRKRKRPRTNIEAHCTK